MHKQFYLLGIMVAIILLGSLLMLPTKQYRILSLGTDTYKAHHPLFGSRKYSQTVVLDGPMLGVGALLVDLRKSNTPAAVTVTVEELQGDKTTQTLTIPSSLIRDDMVAWQTWDTSLGTKGDVVTITFSAPEATVLNPLGLRFEEDHPTHFAIGVIEKVDVGERIVTIAYNNPDTPRILAALAVSFILALLLTIPLFISNRTVRISFFAITLAVILILAFTTRLYFMNRLYGASGGDPYNYLFITKNISNFENPFVGVKRLPGFPLLLVPAFVTDIDDVYWMRFVSVVSSLGILVMVVALARSLKLHWSVGILTAVLLVFQKDFFFISTRPEPYTFYTFLLVTALTLFMYIDRPRLQILFSIVLGYAAMTRQEGFILAAILGVCALFYWKKVGWKGYIRLFLPALLIVLPFFIHNTREFGNPFFTPYFEGDRLQIVDSWGALFDSMGAMWGIFGSLWKSSWEELERIPFTSMLLLLSALFTAGWWATRRWLRHRSWLTIAFIAGIMAMVLLLSSLGMRFTNKSLFDSSVMMITAGVLLISPLIFLARVGRNGLVVVAVLLTQILVATWFHPFAKHYQQDYPLIMVMIASAVMVLPTFVTKESHGDTRIPSRRSFVALIPYYTALILPFCLVAFGLWKHVDVFLDETNAETALDSVLSRAIEQTRTLPGPHGFDQAYLPARLYFDTDAHYLLDPEASPSEQREWLTNNNIQTLLVTTDSTLFRNPDPTWKRVGHYKAAGKEDRIAESFIYEIPHRQD